MIESLLVFDSSRGQREGTEGEKIIHYWPESTISHLQLKHVGLSEALINFSTSFSNDSSEKCEIVHLQKHRFVYFNPESTYWLVMGFNNSLIRENVYNEEEYDDKQLETIVIHIYRTLKMFNGSFSEMVSRETFEGARKIAKAIIPKLIRMNQRIDRMTVVDTIQGIQFHAVERLAYLKIQSAIRMTENSFKMLRNSTFMFRDNLIYSGMDLEGLQTMNRFIFQYLYSTPASDGTESDFPCAKRPQPEFKGFVASHLPQSPSSLGGIFFPQIYIGQKKHNMLIYQYQDIRCLFFVADGSGESATELIQQLSEVLRLQMKDLYPLIKTSSRIQDEPFVYVYFNHTNLAFMSSVGVSKSSVAVTKEIWQIISDMRADFERDNDKTHEIIVKTAHDGWVIGRNSEKRELFVALDHKLASLVDANGPTPRVGPSFARPSHFFLQTR
eukprot:TRINITY_DN6839_c0_g1_i1.p1 TRINITY_DN6839_c0_g1~~TRINITY_DN6839_c0_g1_i1.p1  ORF type:complete len:449 (+),score=162.64 TRINITY_DN6839_c0_g1_i1:23-1348(+)